MSKYICIALIIIAAFLFSGNGSEIRDELSYFEMLSVRQKVLDFARKHWTEDSIVVSKKSHLLYYCRYGRIVQNDFWGGHSYNFPVKVSLASRYYRTPEGEFEIETKNDQSQYIRFLGFKGLYGIHSGATRLASYLDEMETRDPYFTFVTKKDDTRGCVAVENRVIKYLFAKVDVKTPVLIMP
jgi:lipoprotein-anchoring transpeptidase ErfK/SrfK